MLDADGTRVTLFTKHGAALAWIVGFGVIAFALQIVQPAPYDADTAYHFAVGRLIAERGLLHDFPWTAWSIFADRYADKELLLHVAFAPLASLELADAATVVGTLLGAALLTSLYLVLRAEGARFPGAWTLIALAGSGAFIVRFALVRPHLMAILLAVVVTWAAARRRLIPLAVACAVFPLAYIAWHQALILVAIVELAYVISGRPTAWRPAAVAIGALALGVCLHPNFPANLELFWTQNVEILVNTAWGSRGEFALGGEFNRFTATSLGRYMLIPGTLTIAAGVALFRHRRDDPVALSFVGAAFAYLVLTLATQRFIEYFAPFAAIASGIALRRVTWRFLAPLVLLVSIAHTSLFGARVVEGLTQTTPLFPRAVREALQEAIPRGALVMTCDWQFTGEMMIALPDRRFIVALDPVFFWKKDPERYLEWFNVVRKPTERPVSRVRERFGANYILCDSRPAWAEFRAAVMRDPDALPIMTAGPWFLAATSRGP